MKFKPEYKFNLINESDYNEKMKEISAVLAECSDSGYAESYDGTKLSYEYFLCEDARASVIIVHGFTEFAKKFYETAYYFLNMGYNVFLYDQRGHGYSDRVIKNTELTHVEKFDDYVADLECIIDKIVLPVSGGIPLYLFSHSMGGSVATLYLMQCGDKIAKTVLCAPMVEPCAHNIPRFALSGYIKHLAKSEGWQARFPHLGDFDPEAAFEHSSDLSYNRFKSNLEMRVADVHYRNSTATYRWMLEAANVCKKMLVREELGKISSKVLMFVAGRDSVVKIKPQLKLAKLIPDCVLEIYPESKHSVYTGTPETIQAFFNRTLEFFSEE